MVFFHWVGADTAEVEADGRAVCQRLEKKCRRAGGGSLFGPSGGPR